MGSLQGLARHFMAECKSVVIGMTGSVGKTTTKEFIATLLEGKFKVGKTHLNYNTKLTYPITLLNRTGDEDVLVVELGMSEPGDIGRLVAYRSSRYRCFDEDRLCPWGLFPARAFRYRQV